MRCYRCMKEETIALTVEQPVTAPGMTLNIRISLITCNMAHSIHCLCSHCLGSACECTYCHSFVVSDEKASPNKAHLAAYVRVVGFRLRSAARAGW